MVVVQKTPTHQQTKNQGPVILGTITKALILCALIVVFLSLTSFVVVITIKHNDDDIHFLSSLSSSSPLSASALESSSSSSSSWSDDTAEDETNNKPTIIIAGLVQNAERHLAKLEQTIERISSNFRVVQLVFYENDSTDNTVPILKSWSKPKGPAVLVISETNVTTINPRTRRLAYARNRLMSTILSVAESKRFEYMLIMDMDEVNYHLANVEECFNTNHSFGACCANQYTIHYDLWPLRTYDNWMTCDIWQGCGRLSVKAVSRFYRHISASAEPFQVRGCFGGAALYNFTMIKDLPLGTYYNWTDRDPHSPKVHPVCEHVPFHKAIQRERPEFTMYIQPKMLNDGPSTYDIALEMAAKRLRPQWELSLKDVALQQFYKFMND